MRRNVETSRISPRFSKKRLTNGGATSTAGSATYQFGQEEDVAYLKVFTTVSTKGRNAWGRGRG